VPLSHVTAYRIIQTGDRFQVVMQAGTSVTGMLMGFSSEEEATEGLNEYLRQLRSRGLSNSAVCAASDRTLGNHNESRMAVRSVLHEPPSIQSGQPQESR
jgi:hypothetical protein